MLGPLLSSFIFYEKCVYIYTYRHYLRKITTPVVSSKANISPLITSFCEVVISTTFPITKLAEASEKFGRGECLYGMHADPDENGHVSHYDIMFNHGIEKNMPIFINKSRKTRCPL